MTGGPLGGALRRFKGLFNTGIDWDNWELVDRDCPSCGCEEYYFKSGPRFGFDVYRCRECGYEEIGR